METITTIGGVLGIILGAAALILQRLNEGRAAKAGEKAGEVAAKDVSARSMEAAARVLEQALERMDGENALLRTDVAGLRGEVGELRAAVERCELEKIELRRELEALR